MTQLSWVDLVTSTLSLASSCGRCGLADRSNGAELFGWCFTKIFIESVPTPDSETDRQRVHFPARQEGNSCSRDWCHFRGASSTFTLYLFRTGRTAYFLYSWSSTTTFLLLVWMTFADFSTESRGQWAALWATSPLLSCCCCCCSTKWNSFAILGRAHVHGTHTQTHTRFCSCCCFLVASRIYKNGKSHSPAPPRNFQEGEIKRNCLPTHGRTENYSMHTEN